MSPVQLLIQNRFQLIARVWFYYVHEFPGCRDAVSLTCRERFVISVRTRCAAVREFSVYVLCPLLYVGLLSALLPSSVAVPAEFLAQLQLVLHNHFTLNSAKVNIPSYLLKAGDVIQVKEKSRGVQKIEVALEIVQQRGVPEWLELELDKMQVTIKDLPARDQVPESIEEQLVVELYSK